MQKINLDAARSHEFIAHSIHLGVHFVSVLETSAFARARALLAGGSLLALTVAASAIASTAATAVETRRTNAQQSQAAEPAPKSPLTMIISLNKQRMWVYDANGFVTQSKVSTGKPGHETPKGIYTIIQKKVDHTSNIYEGAKMPYMQRLLQTGIAMHGGVVPGYPASAGCIRMPFAFAPKLFAMTSMNERVIVTPEAQSPVPFEHANLFSALPKGDGSAPQAALVETSMRTDVGTLLGVTPAVASQGNRTMASLAAERANEREQLVTAIEAAKTASLAANEAITTTAKAAADARAELKQASIAADKLARTARKAQAAKQAAERRLKDITRQIAKKANRLRADQLAELQMAEEEAQAALVEASQSTALIDAENAQRGVADLREKANAAAAAHTTAKKAAKTAALAIPAAEKAVASFDRRERNRHMPISVLISPRNGKVLVRQGWETILDEAVTIERPADPLGTYLFTATGWRDASETEMTWSAVSVGETNPARLSSSEPVSNSKKKKKQEDVSIPPATDGAKAAAALSRIAIPEKTRLKIAEVVKPGSTLIISDFDMAKSEVRPGTDFTVQMPEVVAKITAPQRKKIDEEFTTSSGGGWFFFSPPPPKQQRPQKRRPTNPKWNSW